MKATGIVRKVDHLGRIVIPKELRTHYEIEKGSSVEIFTKEEEIILRKYKPSTISDKKFDLLNEINSLPLEDGQKNSLISKLNEII